MTTATAHPTSAAGARAAASAAVAAALNLTLWAIGDSAFDPIEAPAGDDVTRLEWFAVLAATAVGVALAAVAAMVLRRARHPQRAFVALVAAGTVLSIGGPLTGDLGAANAAVLAAMHVVTGTVAVAVLAPLLPRNR